MFDQVRVARQVLEGIAETFDAGALSGSDALRVVEELGTIQRIVDTIVGRAAKRVADARVHDERGVRNAAVLVAQALGVTAGEVRAAVETASKLEHLPVVDRAARAGRLSEYEARMIAEAASANPAAQEELLSAAERGLAPLKEACVAARAAVEGPEERAERQRRLRCLHTWTDVDGMVAGRFRLTPEVGGQVKNVLDRAVQHRFRGASRVEEREPLDAHAADAFAALVLGEGSEGQGVNATVHVVVDHGALVRGRTVEGETCEIPGVGPVSVAWVRELLGEAFVTAVIKRGKDITTVAHFGRHIPAELHTALIVGGRVCDVEGCDVRGYLERDHVHDHAKGGPTSLANLCWLCYRHHRLKSDGWQLGPPDPITRKRKLRPPPPRAA